MSDDEIREALKEIDEDPDVDVKTWEADFLENVLFKYRGPLSAKQREAAEKIIEKYGQ